MFKLKKTFGNSNKAFTLAEVLVVIGIIALLAAISIPYLLSARISSNNAAAQATLKSISNAMENYMAINSVYPSATSELLGVNPPYLSVDYFTGSHNGFNFTPTISSFAYSILATPVLMGKTGSASYTISTGAVLTTN